MRNRGGRVFVVVLVVVGIFLGMAWAGAAEVSVMDIGSRLELFVDGRLIDSLDGTELRLHNPVPAETVLRFNKPWEGRFCGYVTVIKDGDLYRLYYRGFPMAGGDGTDIESTCYAESFDGVTFTRPNLDLFEVNGTRENNVILKGMSPCSHNFSPFIDTRSGVPPAEKYKALGGSSKSGLIAFISPDGIHWGKLREEPVITKGAFDSQNVAFWSESEGCYACYFRTWSEGEWAGIRTVSRTTSKDFINWTEPKNMTFGPTPKEHLYTNQTRPYFRAPHIYLAIAARFMPGRRVISAEQMEALGGNAKYSGDCSDTVFMSSRGGELYDRTFMESFVRPGIGAENWTSRTNYPTYGVVPTGDYEISLYIQRNYGQDSHYLQRLKLRTDGFVSVNAPYAGGEMRTIPITFAGKRLVINYATSAAGSIWVELQDQGGKPIPGYTREDADEIIGDAIERTVTWKGKADVSALSGKPTRHPQRTLYFGASALG